MDIFIKIHHVFNFEYAKEFSYMMYFFEYVVYEIAQSKRFMTPRMMEVANTVMEAGEKHDKENDTPDDSISD